MKDERDVIGIQKVDFVPEGSENRIKGYKFFYLEKFSSDPNFIGSRCYSYWVPEELKNFDFTLGKYEFDISVINGRARVHGIKRI